MGDEDTAVDENTKALKLIPRSKQNIGVSGCVCVITTNNSIINNWPTDRPISRLDMTKTDNFFKIVHK